MLPPCVHFSNHKLIITLYSPLMSISRIQNCYQLLQTTHPSAHPKTRDFIKTLFLPPQPTFNPSVCPGNVWASISVELIPKNPPSKSLRQKLKAFKYYYVLITIFKKENLVLVSSYKTCFNINSNFIWIKYKYHYFNWNVRVISKRYINITSI